jgi:LacI family transcriptional regulator
MTIKFKDIAKQLNISPSTVSMVVNGRPGVNKQTRMKVMKALEEVGVQIEGKKKTSKYIRFLKYSKYGKVVDDNGFISTVTDGVDEGARSLNYQVLISTMNQDNMVEVMNMVRSDTRSGIILLGTELMEEDLHILDGIDVPIVVLDNNFEFADYDCVTMNNHRIGFNAVKYLNEKGFNEIGYLGSSFNTNNFKGRYEGYCTALNSFGLVFNQDFVMRVDSTLDGSYNDFKALLEGGQKLPKAIFSTNDTIAIGAMKAMKEYGIKIPQDVAIMGVDNIPFGTMIEPALTTLAIYNDKMGQIASKRLIEKIEEDDKCIMNQNVSAEIIERESTHITADA